LPSSAAESRQPGSEQRNETIGVDYGFHRFERSARQHLSIGVGPSYVSHSTLGSRRQADSFAFQAQVGAGFQLGPGAERPTIVAVSWKHFANADLYTDNDGIDVPFVISVGMTF
jgi:hypothetical protein